MKLFPMVFFIERASCGQWAQRMTEGTLVAGNAVLHHSELAAPRALPDAR